MKDTHSRITQELLKIRKQIAQIQGTRMPVKADQDMLQDRYDNVEEQMRERIIELGLANNELIQEVTRYRKTEQDLKIQFQELENHLREQITEKELLAGCLNQELNDCKKELEEVQHRARTAEREMQGQQQSKDRLEQKVEVLEEQLAVYAEKAGQATKDADAVKELQVEIETLKQSEDKAKRQTRLLEEHLEQRISELAKNNNVIQQELADEKKKHEQELKQALETDKMLRKRVKELEHVNQELEHKLGQAAKTQVKARKQSFIEKQLRQRIDEMEKAERRLAEYDPEPAAAQENVVEKDRPLAGAVIDLNLDGTILSWDLAAEQMFGYSSQEAGGFPCSILIPREHFDAFRGTLETVRKSQKPIETETVYVKKDGRQIEVQVVVSAIKGEDGQTIGISTVANEVHRAEDDIKIGKNKK